jgi:hypothetical protein
MPSRSERLEILSRVENGELSPVDAARLLSVSDTSSPTPPQTPMGVLEQLEGGEITPEEAARRLAAPPEPTEKQTTNAQKVEVIQGKPAAEKRASSWWLILIGLGALFAVFAAWWMSVDLRDGLGIGFYGHVKFDLDMPVPIEVAGKALHFVGDRVPSLGSESVDRLMQALEQASKDGDPIQIHANSEDGDDSVDITIS